MSVNSLACNPRPIGEHARPGRRWSRPRGQQFWLLPAHDYPPSPPDDRPDFPLNFIFGHRRSRLAILGHLSDQDDDGARHGRRAEEIVGSGFKYPLSKDRAMKRRDFLKLTGGSAGGVAFACLFDDRGIAAEANPADRRMAEVLASPAWMTPLPVPTVDQKVKSR